MNPCIRPTQALTRAPAQQVAGIFEPTCVHSQPCTDLKTCSVASHRDVTEMYMDEFISVLSRSRRSRWRCSECGFFAQVVPPTPSSEGCNFVLVLVSVVLQCKTPLGLSLTLLDVFAASKSVVQADTEHAIVIIIAAVMGRRCTLLRGTSSSSWAISHRRNVPVSSWRSIWDSQRPQLWTQTGPLPSCTRQVVSFAGARCRCRGRRQRKCCGLQCRTTSNSCSESV